MTASNESQDRGPEQSPQLQAFEAQLAALVPRDDRLDRDRLMYRAGQSSVWADGDVAELRRSNRWAIPASAGAAVGALAASLVMTALALLETPIESDAVPALQPTAFAAVDEPAESTGAAPWQVQLLLDPPTWVDGSLSAAGFVHTEPAPRSAPPEAKLEPADIRPPITSRSLDELLQTLDAADRS